jgi:hypothetical protein
MAAFDTYTSFLASLGAKDRRDLKDFLTEERSQLLAARSEEARVRIVTEMIKEVHDRLTSTGRP